MEGKMPKYTSSVIKLLERAFPILEDAYQGQAAADYEDLRELLVEIEEALEDFNYLYGNKN